MGKDYKLYYFDMRETAEAIRLLLHYVGQDFEDVRFKFSDWPQEKPKFFYGKVPVLELADGRQLSQSAAISRFLAEKFNLAGKDAWERAKVNEVIDFYKDVSNEISPYYMVAIGLHQGDKAQLRKEVFEPGVARAFPLYEKLLKESGSGFFAPSGVTFVDFHVAEILDNFRTRAEPDLLKDYPELDAYVKRVFALPQLQNYLASRNPKPV